MIKKIILIIPPTKYSKSMEYDQYLYTPLEGITVLANILVSKFLDIEIFDCRDKKNPIEWVLSNRIPENAIFGITTFFDSFKFVSEITNHIKKTFTKSVTILGGPLATSAYKTFLNYTSSDFVILGEGEISFLSLINFLCNGSPSLPTGIAYKSNSNIYITGPTPILKNLDDIPDLDWTIYADLAKRKFSFTYLIGRGCSNKCSYCNPIFRETRAKSPQKVRRELLYLKNNYGMSSVLFNDLDLLHMEGVEDYCEIFKKLGIKWGCFARPEKLSPNLLKFVKEHNCVNIRLGVESFDQKVLDKNYRGINVEEMEETIKMVLDSGISKTTCYFLIGLPGQTDLSLDRTLMKIEKYDGIIPRPFYLIPLPSTKVYQDALKIGLINSESKYLLSLEKVRLEEKDYIPLNISQVPIPKQKKVFKDIMNIAKNRQKEVSCPITV